MQCKTCGTTSQGKYDFCPNCGAYIKHQSEHRLPVPRFHRPNQAGAQRETSNQESPSEKVAGSQAAAAAPASARNGSAQGNGSDVPLPPTLVAPVNAKALSRSFAQPLQPKSSDPFPTYAGMIIFMAVWLLAILIGFGAAGIYQGLQDQTRIAQASAAEHKAKAKAYIQEGNIELAIEELRFAFKLNSKDPEIVDLLAALQPQQTPQPTATPQLVTVSPSDVLGSAFNEARQAYNQKDYETAITALEGLRRVEPGYHKQEVEDMLFNAYVSLARQYLDEERWEESVQNFDKALAVRKDENVALERYLEANYFRGLTSWAADWKRAVESFAEVVKINPKYLDSFNRLYQARIQYGDYLMERGAPCLAAEQYAAAIVMGVSSALQTKQVSASAACGNAVVPVPTIVGQTPVPTRAPSQTAIPPAIGAVRYLPQVTCCQATNDDTASIRGQVADKLGKPIVKLKIQVFNSSKKYAREETTDEFGFYSFDGLEPDIYGVLVVNDAASTSSLISIGRRQRAIIHFTPH